MHIETIRRLQHIVWPFLSATTLHRIVNNFIPYWTNWLVRRWARGIWMPVPFWEYRSDQKQIQFVSVIMSRDVYVYMINTKMHITTTIHITIKMHITTKMHIITARFFVVVVFDGVCDFFRKNNTRRYRFRIWIPGSVWICIEGSLYRRDTMVITWYRFLQEGKPL